MLLSRFLTGLTVLLMVCFSFNCAAQCDRGWFGNNCQYQCHCAGSAECDNGGHCSSGCAENWFGPACQYVAMGFTVVGSNWLTDSDDSTCNDGTIRTIYAALDTPIPLTWVRVVVNDEAYIDQIRLFKKVQNSNQLTRCSELRKAKVDATTIDISCPTTEPVTDVVLDGEGTCSISLVYEIPHAPLTTDSCRILHAFGTAIYTKHKMVTQSKRPSKYSTLLSLLLFEKEQRKYRQLDVESGFNRLCKILVLRS
ncbi:hypothetical protein RRG08_040546 [Elysia crispata]|uniref:Uncharacterized protein n=1 Tax=Elysia crispata TaxID=231223 RepID=A0AAE1DMK7_9GAST|nr:hypothetical protein RRG08_040546 [Elysia crispata]